MQNEEAIRHNGKTWAELSSAERHTLMLRDEELARSMKEQHDEKPWVGKAFADMTPMERHALANARPRLYAKLRDAFEEAVDGQA